MQKVREHQGGNVWNAGFELGETGFPVVEKAGFQYTGAIANEGNEGILWNSEGKEGGEGFLKLRRVGIEEEAILGEKGMKVGGRETVAVEEIGEGNLFPVEIGG